MKIINDLDKLVKTTDKIRGPDPEAKRIRREKELLEQYGIVK